MMIGENAGEAKAKRAQRSRSNSGEGATRKHEAAFDHISYRLSHDSRSLTISTHHCKLTMCDWDLPWCLPSKEPEAASLAGARRCAGRALEAIVMEDGGWKVGVVLFFTGGKIKSGKVRIKRKRG